MKNSVRLSHVIVVAIAALALLFGSATVGAVAGAKWIDGKRIEKNSIPANRLQNATITGKQLKKGTIKGDRIAKRTIGTQALTSDAVEELQPTVEYVDNVFTANFGEVQQVAAPCPTGTQAVGGYVKSGGYAPADGASFVDQAQNAFVIRIATAATTSQVTVQTICLR